MKDPALELPPAQETPSQPTANESVRPRRRFLLALGAGAAATLTDTGSPTAVPASAPAVHGEAPPGDGRYWLSEHVRKYYATARIF